MNMKNNFNTSSNSFLVSLLLYSLHFTIVSPSNDELIEIRFVPLPHDLKSNQTEVKRIFPSFAFRFSFVLFSGVNEKENFMKKTMLKWIQFTTASGEEKFPWEKLNQVFLNHLKVLLERKVIKWRKKVFKLSNSSSFSLSSRAFLGERKKTSRVSQGDEAKRKMKKKS